MTNIDYPPPIGGIIATISPSFSLVFKPDSIFAFMPLTKK